MSSHFYFKATRRSPKSESKRQTRRLFFSSVVPSCEKWPFYSFRCNCAKRTTAIIKLQLRVHLLGSECGLYFRETGYLLSKAQCFRTISAMLCVGACIGLYIDLCHNNCAFKSPTTQSTHSIKKTLMAPYMYTVFIRIFTMPITGSSK